MRLLRAGVLLAVSAALVACSTPAASTPASVAPPTASAAPSAAASQSSTDTTKTVYGYTSSPSMDSLPYLVAIKNMVAAGYDISLQQLASNDLGLAALATNQIQLWGTGPVEWSRVVGQAPIKLVTARANNGWQLISTADITECSQLQGQKVGFFNLTGISTAYPTAYFQQNCPDMKPEIVLIPDSGLRAQAMAADQLKATPLQADDAVKLLNTYPGKFKVLANFSADLPEIGRDYVGTNNATLDAHPAILREFIKQHLLTIRAFYADPAVAIAAAKENLEVGADAELVTNFFIDQKLWCANGGLEDGNLGSTLSYFGDFGLIAPGLSAANFLAPGPLTDVLTEIGRSEATKC
jgi:ABC-type nitrate/sulfonate/bicarbonate transport system substrate-binding protein